MDVQPYTMTASLKCNKSKNRYVDILASESVCFELCSSESGQ